MEGPVGKHQHGAQKQFQAFILKDNTRLRLTKAAWRTLATLSQNLLSASGSSQLY